VFPFISTHLNIHRLARTLRGPMLFTLTLLGVELLDELIYGVEGAALPLIRDDLALTYTQVGLLLTLPHLVGNVLDPVIGVLGDVWRRKALIVIGALVTALAMLLVAFGYTFPALILAFCLSYPASTAYVSLSQGTLMDLNPGRHDQMMARWTVLGAVGQFAGPALVAATLTLGFGWRGLYVGLALLAGLVALIFWRQRFNGGHAAESTEAQGLVAGLRELPRAIRTSGVLRWIILIELADLLLDVFYNFCALYFTDVVRVSPAVAGVAVAVLTLSGLAGDVLLIPLLEKYDGVRLIRRTALVTLIVYAAFLLAPGVWAKFALLVMLGPLRSGWYQVLQGRAYSCLPGKSGTVIAIGSLGGMFAASFPVILGAVAERVGLGWAMVILTLAPISLLVGLPRVDR
jgi:FSR family fosmidomycin resistance protein-like MFS transporter